MNNIVITRKVFINFTQTESLKVCLAKKYFDFEFEEYADIIVLPKKKVCVIKPHVHELDCIIGCIKPHSLILTRKVLIKDGSFQIDVPYTRAFDLFVSGSSDYYKFLIDNEYKCIVMKGINIEEIEKDTE